MGPDKRFCQICDGVSVVGCSFKGGSLCKPERVRMPPSADRNRDDIATLALANRYVKLDPGQVVVSIPDVEMLTEFFNGFCPPAWIFEACERINHAIKEARDE